MATLNNPGPFDCLAKLRQNPKMPYFLLLASDPDAAKIVRNWGCLRMNRPDPKGKAAEAFKVAGDMEAWRIQHEQQKLDDCCMDGWSIVPMAEDIFQFLFRGWRGGFICGAGLMLAIFAVWVTR